MQTVTRKDQKADSQDITDLRRHMGDMVSISRVTHLRNMTMTMLGRSPFGSTKANKAATPNSRISGAGPIILGPDGSPATEWLQSQGQSSVGMTDMPYFQLIVRTVNDFMKPNPMLTNLRTMVAETRAVDIAPEWTNVADPLIKSARGSWWEERSQGIDGHGSWKDDFDRGYQDFVYLGQGFQRAVVKQCEDGNRVGPAWYSALDVATNPLARHIEETPDVIFRTVYSREDCQKNWPDHDWEHEVPSSLYTTEGVRMMGFQIYEYFHRDYKMGKPTYVCFLNSFNGPVMGQATNPWEMLPLGVFTSFQPPGAAMPIGLAELQAYDSQEVQDEERWIKEATNREGQIGIVEQFIHKDDWMRIAAGESPQYIRVDFSNAIAMMQANPQLKPFYEVPRLGVSQDHYKRVADRSRSMQMNSATTDNSSGVQTGSSQPLTAHEIESMNAGEDKQTNFFSREWARGMVPFAVVLAKGAAKFDTAEFSDMFKGKPVLWNAHDARLTAKTCFQGPIRCKIGDESLMVKDSMARNSQAAQRGIAWLTAVTNPVFLGSPKALAAYGEALGVTTPEDDFPAPQPQPMNSAMGPGMPGKAPGPGGPPPAGPGGMQMPTMAT